MVPRFGESASEIPVETQMLLLEASEDCAIVEDPALPAGSSETTFYILLLPVLDGPFRTSLQGNSDNELQFCAESGKRCFQIITKLFLLPVLL